MLTITFEINMKLSLATTLAAFATYMAADGCHKSSDIIGKQCKFLNKDVCNAAVNNWCDEENGLVVQQGQSLAIKTGPWDDGSGTGAKQLFFVDYRVDRNGVRAVEAGHCKQVMRDLWAERDGFGGWTDTESGTIFVE
ncbi:hypothetical protein AC579_7791 [Pseudocercospora musae]|uniref:Ecp2 effector protein domain-containing protein n=1 Tax=Pseudocercospora musae TaxID=113226 RepID=A0A139IJ85_9PEZI|nr:hypothetical protein AC579_7791 [Pseudocercospora musae]